MDFSSLLESKAIREHCKSIGYNFNIRQATYIIYNNSKLTLNQKLKYYKYLIDNSLDVDLDCKKYKSYKELLSKYIVETRKLQKCFKRMENCNYTAIIHYKDRPFRKVNISTFDIEELKDFIKTIIKYDKDYLKNMEYIRVVCVCNDAHISYHFNKKSQMLEALNDDILTDLI